MYSDENKNGFSILDLVIRIIFAALFIFILIWLFQKKVPNMTTFYSSVFRENIEYMQDAAESYFTDDKMPEEVNDTVKITLSEMISKKIILPFVDKDGNECDGDASYVSITKEQDESYTLKTNLVCNKESDYVLKILGCHTYCKDDNCNKTCQKEQIISYQYKKQMTGKKTTYSCSDGYTLDGKYCYKTVLNDTKSAVKTTTKTNTLTADATFVEKSASKITTLETTKTSNKTYANVTSTTNKSFVDSVASTNKNYVDSVSTTVAGSTSTKQVAYTCQKSKTERKCSTSYQTSTYSYSCNCTTHTVNFKDVVTCSTCTGTSSTPVETCSDVEVKYNDTCYRTETQTTPSSTTYSCPSGYTQEGSGSSLKCYKSTTTYSCPAGYTQEGSGSSLKCYKSTTTYSCPAGYTQEGSGSSAKCYKLSYSYSCPSGTTATSGSGKYLKCYKAEKGSYAYECSDSSYTLNGTKCYKTVTEEVKSLSCDAGYTQEGETCKKYTTEKESAKSNTSTYKYYSYKWSTETSLSGWTKTGKTKTEEGEEVCK